MPYAKPEDRAAAARRYRDRHVNDPEFRARVRKLNRDYHAALVATPEGRERKRRYNRETNKRRAAEVSFRQRLMRLLLGVRRAVIASGRVPFDG